MLRVLRMVGELHQRGYQRLRIVPGMAPSGMHWRCTVLPALHVSPLHGALWAGEPPEDMVARYTSGQDNEYFGWTDATNATASDLADLFERRFPQIVAAGKGDDWEYAGWFQLVLGLARKGAFPSAFDDSPGERDPRHLGTVGNVNPTEQLPMPPPAPVVGYGVVPTRAGGVELQWTSTESKRSLDRWVAPFYLQLQAMAAQEGYSRRHWVRAAGEAGFWFTEQTARQLYAMANWRSWMTASFFLVVRKDLLNLSDWTAWRATWDVHGSQLQLLALAARDAAEPLREGLHHGKDPSAHWAALSLGGDRCQAALREEGLPDPMTDEAALAAREQGVRLFTLADEVRASVAGQRRVWRGG